MDQLLKNYEAVTGRAQVGASIMNAAMHRDAAMAAVQQDAAAQEQKMQLARAQMAQEAQGQQQQQDFRLALQDQQQQGDMSLLERRFSLQQEQQLHELAGAEDYANQMLARAGNDPMARQTAQAWLQAVAARRYGISPSLLPRPPQTEVPPLFGSEQSASPQAPPQGIPGGGAGMMGSFVSAGPEQGAPGGAAGMAGAFGGTPTPQPQPQGPPQQNPMAGWRMGPFGPRSAVSPSGTIYQQDPHTGMMHLLGREAPNFNAQQAYQQAARSVDQELARFQAPLRANEQPGSRERPFWLGRDPVMRGLIGEAVLPQWAIPQMGQSEIADAREREIARRVQQARNEHFMQFGGQPPGPAGPGGPGVPSAPQAPQQEGGPQGGVQLSPLDRARVDVGLPPLAPGAQVQAPPTGPTPQGRVESITPYANHPLAQAGNQWRNLSESQRNAALSPEQQREWARIVDDFERRRQAGQLAVGWQIFRDRQLDQIWNQRRR